MPYTRNGSPQPDTGFNANGVNYPAGWISNPNNKSQWAALNIVEVAAEVPYDKKFYL